MIANRLRLACAAFVSALLASADAAAAERPAYERFGLYVLADDIPRAKAFYEKLFAKPPQVNTRALAGFDVAGGLYAIVSRKEFGPNARSGGSVRPYIKVRDIQAAFAHAKAVAADQLESEAVVEEGAFRFFRIEDPEGNVIEFFSVTAHPGQ